MKILADASVPNLEKAFPTPFIVELYHNTHEVQDLLADHEILICRSTLTLKPGLLDKARLRYVATASSGVDHIDQEYLKAQGIQCLDAKGSNASAVADYLIATVAYLQQQNRLSGNQAGIIGMGAVGREVAKWLSILGFTIKAYDPPLSEQSHFISCTLEEIARSDLICIHANLHQTLPHPSYHLLTESFFKQLKPQTVIINAARGMIVDEAALISSKTAFSYCTDVYANEPDINKKIVDFSLICTPHIAGHTFEAKQLATIYLSQKLHAAYRLEPPVFEPCNKPLKRPIKKISRKTRENWQDYILSLYNPLFETLALKQASHLEQAFLNLRKQHKRHALMVEPDELIT